MKPSYTLRRQSRRKFDTDKEFLTESEFKYFNKLLDTGEISYFRTSNCVVCQKTIPKYGIFKYCSKNCKEKEVENEDQRDDETR